MDFDNSFQHNANVGMICGIVFSSLFVIIIIVVITCVICRSRKMHPVIYPNAPVVVTSATHTAPGGYPTGMQTVPVYPPSAYQQQGVIYPQQAPYPVTGASSTMPMPQMQHQMQPNPVGMNPRMMPPYPMAGPGMNPPSYDSAVGPNPAAYEKQSPYNPSYPN